MPGGQAEYLRVPQAQFGPIKVPDGAPDEQYLYLSDILPTAYQAVAYADVPEGGTLAVLGLGPIGQLAARIARHRGVPRVIGVDLVPERRAAAGRFGVETLDPEELDDTSAALVELVDGRGPDAVIDAVGMEAHGHDEPRGPPGSPSWPRRPPACCRTRRPASSPTRPGWTGWTRCTPRSRRCAGAARSRSAGSTAVRSTRCR